eukprot:scaffold10560_cov272-Chaetoceros_neogracile.AAC.2
MDDAIFTFYTIPKLRFTSTTEDRRGCSFRVGHEKWLILSLTLYTISKISDNDPFVLICPVALYLDD